MFLEMFTLFCVPFQVLLDITCCLEELLHLVFWEFTQKRPDHHPDKTCRGFIMGSLATITQVSYLCPYFLTSWECWNVDFQF